jgi:serine/threonine-protein kinase
MSQGSTHAQGAAPASPVSAGSETFAPSGSFPEFLPGPPPGPVPALDLEPAAPVIPGYEILGVLGRGGMGVVYRARQVELDREVALKMILAGGHAGPEERARFRSEALAIARLRHPHVVQIHEVGEHNGLPYFSLELMDAGSLAQRLGGKPLPAQPAAQLVETLARAVHTAHQQGILHRDLKPGNVLLTADGTPKIADFGLAKRLQGASGQTPAGAILGTPNYMAPEQAVGDNRPIGPAADVYALGAILYELLTGRPPFNAATPLDTIMLVVNQEPLPPRRPQPSVPRDLENICLKCLEKEPAKRYATALELAEDLGRFRAGEPIRAHPVGRMRRLAKWARRRPAAAALGGVGLVLIFGAGAGATWWAVARAALRADTEQAMNRALGQAEQLRDQARQMAAEEPVGVAAALAVWKQGVAAAEQAEGIGAAGLAGDETAGRAARLLHELRAGTEGAGRDLARARKETKFLADLDNARLARSRWKGRSFDAAAGAKRYGQAFADYGLDVLGRPPAAAARAVRRLRPTIRLALVVALDDWAICERRPKAQEHLRAVADGADDDPWRRRLRAASDLPALKRLAAEARCLALPPASLELLAVRLKHRGARAEAVSLLREVQGRYPNDFWINFNLGNALWLPGLRSAANLDEAITYRRIAVALRPDNAAARTNLGTALRAKGDLAGAIREHRQAIALEPQLVNAHNNLGNALMATGDRAGAIKAFRRAIELDPQHASAHSNLGNVLRAAGDVPGAIREYRRAIELDPKYPNPHNGLATVFHAKGDWTGAIREYRRAIELDPEVAGFHNNLGLALKATGDLAGAAREYCRAIELNPEVAEFHTNLGIILHAQRDAAGAIQEFRRAVVLNPKNARAHDSLGVALLAQEDRAGAIKALRRAVLLDPKSAEAHFHLGETLREEGLLQESLEHLRQGHRLAMRRPGWRYPSGQWVQQAQRLAELDRQLPAFLRGDRKPQGAGESLELARVCYYKRRFAACAGFYRTAFAEDPKREPPSRYSAACAAALAGCGQGKDAAQSTEDQKRELRRQALAWLRAELERGAKLLGPGSPPARATVRRTLGHWQKGRGLAGVRDAAALAKLPEAERKEWAKLWREVTALLAKASPMK